MTAEPLTAAEHITAKRVARAMQDESLDVEAPLSASDAYTFAAAAITAMRPAPDAPKTGEGAAWNQGYAAAMADMQYEARETGL